MPIYKYTPTLGRFHASEAFYRGIMGPVGSGKSTACVCEIISRAQEQVPARDGVRRTRFAIIRNTYSQLHDTTLKTWLDWVKPTEFGEPTKSPFNHVLKFKSRLDNTIIECEVLFRPLDRPDDIGRVLSLELTGAWVNEAREVPKGLIDALGDRVGRYPAKKDGGCTWRGIIMDTNPPDEDHWWYHLAEEERPPTWEFFRQPGGLIEQGGKFIVNPAAENIENLEKDYYVTRQYGKTKEYIRVYYCAQYGFVQEGKPVWPEYYDTIHCAPDILKPIENLPVFVGVDFGLTPAATFGQRLTSGRWIIIDEIVTEDMGTVRFAELLSEKLRHDYQDFKIEIYGDPAGDTRSQVDERTPFQILRNIKNIPIMPAPTNDFLLRREAVAVPLQRLLDGKPGLIISPKCKTLRKGMAGGYCYRRIQIAGDERYQDKPDKNKYSHPCDSLQYMLMGAGEGRNLIHQPERKKRQQRRINTRTI